MKSERGRGIIIAVIFSAILVMGSGAEASGLFALDSNPAAEHQVGLFGQAVQWLSGAWTDLKMVFGQDETTTPVTPTCTNPDGCGDAGPGIDPIG